MLADASSAVESRVVSPEFSVVITTYNEEENIARLLDSIQKQKLKPTEIIIVDDSTDRTPEIIRSYSKSLPIKLVKREYRIGSENSILLGLQMAKCKYVVLLHADQELTDGFFEKVLEPLKDDKIGAVGVTQIIPPGARDMDKLFSSFRGTGVEEDKFVTHIITGAYKKEVLEKVGYFDPSYKACAEIDLSRRIVNSGYKILKSSQAQVYLWEGSTSDTLLKKFKREVYYAKPIPRFCLKYPDYIKWPLLQLGPLTFPLAFFFHWYLWLLLLYFLVFSLHSSIVTYRKLRSLKPSLLAFLFRPVRLLFYSYGFLLGLFALGSRKNIRGSVAKP